MNPINGKEPVIINDKTALQRKLKEIKLNYDWVERLDLTNSHEQDLPDEQVDNDFNREMMFYRQAQAAVLEGLQRLQSIGVPTKRPIDYFAQMAKSDEHMKKVRQALAEREAMLEKIEKVKKFRKERKMSKMVQTQVKLAKQAEKKELLDKVNRFKKGKEKNLDFLEETKLKKSEKKPEKKPTKKALYKKTKYGMGGQKKRSKYNTKESAADVSQYSRKKNSGSGGRRAVGKRSGTSSGGSGRSGKSTGGRGKSKKKNRPGKTRRTAMKSK